MKISIKSGFVHEKAIYRVYIFVHVSLGDSVKVTHQTPNLY